MLFWPFRKSYYKWFIFQSGNVPSNQYIPFSVTIQSQPGDPSSNHSRLVSSKRPRLDLTGSDKSARTSGTRLTNPEYDQELESRSENTPVISFLPVLSNLNFNILTHKSIGILPFDTG